MATLEDGSVVPVPDDQLPVILPEDVKMDGITSQLKRILSGLKQRLMVNQRYVKQILLIPLWNLLGITHVIPALITTREC